MIVAGMLFRLVQAFAQRIFRHLLQIGIDGGVNAKTFVHGPVPADRGNDLLTDIIDRIRLALRALPAADRDVFRLCCLTLRPRDEPEIAHAAERDVARIARRCFVAPR